MLRPAILAALARPGAPTRTALARAAGLAPENLTHWLAGRRPIPQEKIEAMLVQLDLDVRPRVRAPDQRKLRYWIMGLESERGAAGSLNVDDEHEVAEVLRSFLDQPLPLSRRTLDDLASTPHTAPHAPK